MRVVLGLTLVLIAMVVMPPLFLNLMLNSRGDNPGRKSSCQSNLKQLGLGMLQYSQDYDEVLPPVSSHAASYVGWADALQPYLKSTQILHCPQESTSGQSDPHQAGYTDYWMNSRLSKLPLKRVASVAYTLAMGDGNTGSDLNNARYSLHELPAPWLSDEKSPAYRHQGTGNYLFADGHVKAYVPSAIDATESNMPKFAVH